MRAPSSLLPPSSFLFFSFFYGLDHPDTSIPAASKMAQVIFRDQNYVSSDIHFVWSIYTMSIHSIAPYTLYVYIHHVYTLDIPSI